MTKEEQHIDQKILSLIRDQNNHEAGFKLLMDVYQKKIYWLIRKMVSNHRDTDDIIQEVFIKVFKGIPSFKGEAKLYTWIYRIAVNETLAFIRKEKNKVIPIDSISNQLENKFLDDNYYNGDEIKFILDQAIKSLPEKQKMVFNLRYFQEMKYGEMAEVLDSSVGGLKANFHHAVKKIEQYIKDYGAQAS